MKRTLFALTLVAFLGLAATVASARPTTTLLIRHQVRGCHAWSVNGGAFKVSQTVRLTRGSTLTVVNNDVMAHKLIKTAGPKVTMHTVPSHLGDMSHQFKGPGVMAHMGAAVHVTFSKAGVYRFTTKAGEDYMNMKGMETIGEDNVLTLKVVVS
jgi:plastocyanin